MGADDTEVKSFGEVYPKNGANGGPGVRMDYIAVLAAV